MADADDQRRTVVRLKVLGSFEIERDGEPLPLPSQAAAERLLVLLAIRERYTAREVVGFLWPDSDMNDYEQAKSVRNLLDRAASDARAALGLNAASGFIKRDRGSLRRVAKNSAIEFTSDWDDFDRLAKSPEVKDWLAALGLIRGPVVQFLDTKNMKPDWIDEARATQRQGIEDLVKDVRPDDTSEQRAAYVEQILDGRPLPALEETRPEPTTRVPRALRPRWLLAAGLVVVLVSVLALVLLSGGASIPPEGSVINAQTGEVVDHPRVTASHMPAQLEFGGIFRACDLSSKASCGSGHSGLTPLKVKVGDIVAFRVTLNDGFSVPINYLKLVAYAFPVTVVTDARSRPKKLAVSPTELEVWMSVKWPERLGAQEIVNEPGLIHGHEYGERGLHIHLKLPRAGHYSLAYIPGSTTLINDETKFFHYLPDGILRTGIDLENIGPPRSCFWCAQQYIRYVYFHLRVTRR